MTQPVSLGDPLTGLRARSPTDAGVAGGFAQALAPDDVQASRLGRPSLPQVAEGVAQRVSATSTPDEAQVGTGAAAQAACGTIASPTRPTLPRLLTRTEMGSYRPGWGLCDSLRAKQKRQAERPGRRRRCAIVYRHPVVASRLRTGRARWILIKTGDDSLVRSHREGRSARVQHAGSPDREEVLAAELDRGDAAAPARPDLGDCERELHRRNPFTPPLSYYQAKVWTPSEEVSA
jgi:hypothetical protein